MPDKIYARCDKGCLRCWKNKLKHANPTVKKYMKKHNIQSFRNIHDPVFEEIEEAKSKKDLNFLKNMRTL